MNLAMNQDTRNLLQERIRALSSDQISRAVAALEDQRSGNQVLVGYVVPDDGWELDGSDVRNQLIDVLPLTSVPTRVAVLAAVPQTADGKVNQHQIEQLCRTSTESSGTRSDDDPVEAVVGAVWRRELGLPEHNEIIDFFRAGGTSIGAIRTLALINAELSIDLPLVTMFRYPRSDLFAARIWEHASDAGGPLLTRASTALRGFTENRR